MVLVWRGSVEDNVWVFWMVHALSSAGDGYLPV